MVAGMGNQQVKPGTKPTVQGKPPQSRGQALGHTQNQTSKSPGHLSGKAPSHNPGKPAGHAPSQMQGKPTDQTSGKPPGQTPGKPPGQMPDKPPGQTPGKPQGQAKKQPEGEKLGWLHRLSRRLTEALSLHSLSNKNKKSVSTKSKSRSRSSGKTKVDRSNTLDSQPRNQHPAATTLIRPDPKSHKKGPSPSSPAPSPTSSEKSPVKVSNSKRRLSGKSRGGRSRQVPLKPRKGIKSLDLGAKKRLSQSETLSSMTEGTGPTVIRTPTDTPTPTPTPTDTHIVAPPRKPHSFHDIHDSIVRKPFQLKVPPCPKGIKQETEARLIKGFLDFGIPHVVPQYGDDVLKCPRGLEFLNRAEYIHLDLRRVCTKMRVCYPTYSQFDLVNEKKDNLLMSFGIESTTRCQVLCFLESRSFKLFFYDYAGFRAFKAEYRPSVLSSLTRYCCCCCCGSNACGHNMTIYDNLDKKIGSIQQCGCCTRRLLMYMENDIHMDSSQIQRNYTVCEFFKDGRREDARILKFDVFDSQNRCFVRIEQHMDKSYLCKFIYSKTMEPVGYVRKGGNTILQLDLWRDFRETEKAILIAAAVLLDHLIIGISMEGSVVDPHQLGGLSAVQIAAPLNRSAVYKFFCFNLCRTVCLATLLVLLLAGIIVVIVVLSLG